MNEANTLLQKTRIICPDREFTAAAQEWKAHPTFPGVWMKNLILGKDTGGSLSCHLVRVEKNCSIGAHVHAGSVELHEVVSGSGLCLMEDAETKYIPGVVLVIPAGSQHEVRAVESDLFMIARFAPALM